MNAKISQHISLVKNIKPFGGLSPSEIAQKVSAKICKPVTAVSIEVPGQVLSFDINFRQFDAISAPDLSNLKLSTQSALNQIRREFKKAA